MIGYKLVYFFAAKAIFFAFLILGLGLAFNVARLPVELIGALGIIGGLAAAVGRTLQSQEERIKQLEYSLADVLTRFPSR